MIGRFIREDGWHALIFLVVAIGCLIWWGVAAAKSARFDAEAVRVSAVVTDLDRNTVRRSNGSTHYQYYATVRYTPPGATATLVQRRSVPRSFYDNLVSGGRISIKVLPSDPEVIEVAPDALARTALAALLLGVIALGFALPMGYVTLRDLQRKVRLETAGVNVHGRIVNFDAAGRKIRVNLAFTPAGGFEQYAHVKVPPQNPILKLKGGDAVQIRYDPENPTNAAPVL